MANQPLKMVYNKMSPAKRKEQLRNSLWPNASFETWNRKMETGFTTIPRTLSLLMTLIDELEKGKDASRVYCDLWCRAFDDGLVEVSDEEAFAFAAGYISPGRNVRTWRERISILKKHGFIYVKPNGSREYGYILIRHPHMVVQELREKNLLDDNWWGAFTKRASEFGCQLPSRSPANMP